MRQEERQKQLQDPIVDALYDRCVSFLRACDKDDHRAKRRLFGSIQEFWYQRYRTERLPLPELTEEQMDSSDDFNIDQAIRWVSAIMKHIEAKRGNAYVG